MAVLGYLFKLKKGDKILVHTSFNTKYYFIYSMQCFFQSQNIKQNVLSSSYLDN